MDDQSSPSIPKPPTQTTTAKQKNSALRNDTTAEDVKAPKSCKHTVAFVLHEDMSPVNNRVTSETILQQKTEKLVTTRWAR